MKNSNENPVQAMLASLGIISISDVSEIHPRVRDREDVRVLRCARSGVIFLSNPEVIDSTHYTDRDDFAYWSVESRAAAVAACRRDDVRRAAQFAGTIANRRWLDVGTGAGGILDQLAASAKVAAAVEPHRASRAFLADAGYTVFASAEEVPSAAFDVVTLFHVLEHVAQPVDLLSSLRDRLDSDGTIVVEVPHARDVLISLFDLEAFKNFTFWSEHLVLHTRESLAAILSAAGYRDIVVSGYQRFPLENHLRWLAKGQPGGHESWAQLGTPALADAYAAMLDQQDMTDTLIAVARR